ncbi:TetR/AcrR family transcriptional regulator [Rothia nasimurium]|uniref:TetR/AcrR family transcriptional regulator n=1 Tax=Rothia nasimurium TaxID=85336 RepID=UPI003B9E2BD5
MTSSLTLDRRRQRKAATRTSILDAAEQIVLSQGHKALTTKALVEQAEVSERTIFNHFPGLDDILLARLSEYVHELTSCNESRSLPAGSTGLHPATVKDLPLLVEQRFRDRVSNLDGHEALIRATRLALAMVERDEGAMSTYTSQVLGRLAREDTEEVLASSDLTTEQKYELAIYATSLCHSIAFGLARAVDELSPDGKFEAITDTTQITPYILWAMDRVSAGRPDFSQTEPLNGN